MAVASSRWAGTAALVVCASAAAFAALTTSAALVVMLPPQGFSIDARGAPGALDAAHAAVVVDEAHGSAWLLGRTALCSVDLGRGRFSRCVEGPAARRTSHAAAAGALLVVEEDPAAPPDAIAFSYAVFEPDGRLRGRGKAGSDFPQDWAHGARATNVAWDALAGAFIASFDWTSGERPQDPASSAARALVRVPIDPSGSVGEPSVRRVAPDRPAARAVFAGDPPRVLFADRTLRLGSAIEPLAVAPGACVGAAAVSCVAVQGEATAGDEAHVAVVVTAEGRALARNEIAIADVPGAPRLFETVVARERATSAGPAARAPTTGVAEVRAAVRARPAGCDEAACEQLIVPLPDGGRATFEVREAGGERVVFARRGSGAFGRVARGASPIAAWTAVPHRDGVLLLDAAARRGVALDRDLRPVDPPSSGYADLGAKLRERLARDDLDVKLTALAILAYVPLFALGLRAAIRARRGGLGARAVAALAAWTVLTALFLLVRRGALFPP